MSTPHNQPPTTLPPAGWYPDPQRPGATRWWDGFAWAAPHLPQPTRRRLLTNGRCALLLGVGLVMFVGGSIIATAIDSADGLDTTSPAQVVFGIVSLAGILMAIYAAATFLRRGVLYLWRH